MTHYTMSESSYHGATFLTAIWCRKDHGAREETRFSSAAKVLLYALSTDSATHTTTWGTSRGALAGTSNNSIGQALKDRSDDPSHHERTLYHGATSRSSCCKMMQWQYNTCFDKQYVLMNQRVPFGEC